jgi:phage host-nuclease inhibitor protein Gam
MAGKKTRIKDAAMIKVPQSVDECAADINQIGRLAREMAVLQAAMNDEIAVITDGYTGLFTPLKTDMGQLQAGVKAWCEANRTGLTQDGKVKTATFVTGTVQWRQKPPSVLVKGVDSVLETLARLGFERFIRTKQEINKEAILNEPLAVLGIAGLTVKTGEEDFVIAPFEQDNN